MIGLLRLLAARGQAPGLQNGLREWEACNDPRPRLHVQSGG